jgi:sodium-independent sulfate anion transporter 11
LLIGCQQNGLYSSFIGPFVYLLLGTSKDCCLGPSAVTSLLTSTFALAVVPNDPTVAILLAFLCSFVYLAFFILSLGAIVIYVTYMLFIFKQLVYLEYLSCSLSSLL